MIRIRDLRVDYDNVCAVRDLSLEVEPGEVCGLIGPNGAGKTTTMRAMIGLIEPTYGEINVMGVDVRERPQDVCRLVGFMPDFPPVYDDLLVWEFLDLFAASYGMPRDRRPFEVGRHLEMVGLAEKREVLVVELSRGMRQRLMLAKTLIPEPRRAFARRARQRRRSPGADRPQKHPPPPGRGGEDRFDLVAHPGRDERVLHVGRDHGARVAGGRGRIDDVNRRVMGETLVVVEVLGDPEVFVSIVESDARAGALERKNGAFEFRFQGDATAASELLTTLVRKGVRVASFVRRKDNLEDLFLKVGSRELS